MRFGMLKRLPAIALVAFAGSTSAHHSQGMFVDTPVWVTGIIVRYRPVDPHAMIELREPQPAAPTASGSLKVRAAAGWS